MINIKRRNEIKEIAEKLLDISLNQIARNNDIKLIIGDLPKMGDKKLSGVIMMEQNSGKYTIYINSNDPITRQRFTFAHELGHFFLHKTKLESGGIIVDKDVSYLYRGDEEYDNLSEENKILEYEANEFAGCLLMPESKVMELKDKMPVNELANFFKVSEQAMTVRLYNLTIRNYE